MNVTYRLRKNESVADGIRRVVLEQLDQAVAEIDDVARDRDDVVHQVRKRCKKIRAVVRLVRPHLGDTFARENAWFRDAARSLAGTRDIVAMLETFDALIEHHKRHGQPNQYDELRVMLTSLGGSLSDEGSAVTQKLRTFRGLMLDARDRVTAWSIDADGFDAVAGGLQKTYERGRRGLKQVKRKPTTERLHEWRKRVKYHWYHVRLLRKIWPDPMEARAVALSTLSDLLGDDHDLAMLRETFIEHGGSVAEHDGLDGFIEMIDGRRDSLFLSAIELGRHLYAEQPDALAARFGEHWNVAHDCTPKRKSKAVPAATRLSMA